MISSKYYLTGGHFITGEIMKTDVRVRYTRKVLRESLFDCLKAKGSLQNVTVKEVCERAELNRTTFYKHYKDCFDLVSQLENDLICDLSELLSNKEEVFKPGFGESVILLLSKYDDLIEAYADGSIGNNLKERIVEVSHELCIDLWKEELPDGMEDEIEMLFSAATAAFLQLVITEKDKRPVEESLAFVSKLVLSAVQWYQQ